MVRTDLCLHPALYLSASALHMLSECVYLESHLEAILTTKTKNIYISVVSLQNHIKRRKEKRPMHALRLTVTNAKSMEGGSSGESASDTAPDIEVSTALILALEGVRW